MVDAFLNPLHTCNLSKYTYRILKYTLILLKYTCFPPIFILATYRFSYLLPTNFHTCYLSIFILVLASYQFSYLLPTNLNTLFDKELYFISSRINQRNLFIIIIKIFKQICFFHRKFFKIEKYIHSNKFIIR